MTEIVMDKELADMLFQDLTEAGYETLDTVSHRNLSCICAKLVVKNGDYAVDILEISQLQKIIIPIDAFRVAFHPDLVAKVLGEEEEFITALSESDAFH